MTSQKYDYLKLLGNTNRNSVFSTFLDMFKKKQLTDVTLFCDGCKLEAHRIILSAVSPYLRQILCDVPSNQHPFIILNDVDYTILTYIMCFIYEGEISIEKCKLDELLKCAVSLNIISLIDVIKNHLYEPYQIVTTSLNNSEETLENSRQIEIDNTNSSCDNNSKKRKLSEQQEIVTEDISIKIEPVCLENSNDCIRNQLITDENDEGQPEELSDVKEEDDNLVEDATQTTLTDINTPQSSRFPRESRQCNICGKVFNHPYSLNHHRAVHSGGTQCTICNAVLARKYNLKMHMKARHGM